MHFFSKTKLIAATAIALVSISMTSAQFYTPTNARIDALGGSRVSDVSDIYRYPALMTGYLDHIQTTWDPTTQYAGFVGVKSITDMFSIGVLANQGPMSPIFTDDAVAYLNGYLPAAPFNNDIVVPHLLLGFDLGVVAIGADLFLEYGGYSEFTADSVDNAGSISNPGFRLSAKAEVASLEILAKFGMGFPKIDASRSKDTTISSERASDMGGYMEMGAQVSVPLLGADWVAGLCYTQTDYRFKSKNSIAQKELLPEPVSYAFSLLNAYFGVEFNFAETAVAALGYSIDHRVNAADTNLQLLRVDPLRPLRYQGDRHETYTHNTHAIYAGVENAWDKAWVFDSFQLRGGARYEINTFGGETSGGVDTLTRGYVTTNYSLPARHSRIVPTVGVGVSKAFATVDLSLNPIAWNGLFSGPGVGRVTATVKF